MRGVTGFSCPAGAAKQGAAATITVATQALTRQTTNRIWETALAGGRETRFDARFHTQFSRVAIRSAAADARFVAITSGARDPATRDAAACQVSRPRFPGT